jgi:SAM-dependent methyltransferase
MIELNRNLYKKCKLREKGASEGEREEWTSLDWGSIGKALRNGLAAREFLGESKVPIVLDVGAGEGLARGAILQMFGGAYMGVELLPELENHQKGIHCFPIERTPKEWDGKIDVIFCFHVMEHAINPVEMIDRLSRLLTKRGILLHVTPYDMADTEEAHVCVLDVESWLRLYFNAGLVPLKVQFARFFGLELHMVLCREEVRPSG